MPEPRVEDLLPAPAAGLEEPWSGYVHPWEASDYYGTLWAFITSNVLQHSPLSTEGLSRRLSVIPERKKIYLFNWLKTLTAGSSSNFGSLLAAAVLVSDVLLNAHLHWHLTEASDPEKTIQVVRRGIQMWRDDWGKRGVCAARPE